MEGVSPYIDDVSFGRFLTVLAGKLAAGSQVAYDFKIRGALDNFGREGRTQKPFRLPDRNGKATDDDKKELAKELGDILWYINSVGVYLGYSLEEIAQMNLDKVLSRKQRGKTGGSGDNR